jgi:3-oxoacyl-[acyl-carrier-protein] synthase-3
MLHSPEVPMYFENVSVVSLAHVDGPIRMPSSEIEARIKPTMDRLGIGPGLLQGLAGIHERRVWNDTVQPSECATEAAQAALAQSGIDPKRIGILINTSVCRDYIEPSTACLVHGNLGLAPECMNFDLGNACLGFLNGMDVVGNMIERGQIDYGLVVDGENCINVLESTIKRLQDPNCDEELFRNNFATLTLGSGGVAMLLGRSELCDEVHAFKGGVNLAATQHNRLCRGQVDGMVTDTKKLLFAGIELANQCWNKAKQEMGWSADCLDELVLHQVSKVHTEQLAMTLGLPLDKVFRLYPEYGNIGPASVAIVLSKTLEAGRVKSGDRVALMGIGSGLNCTMEEVVW